MNAEGGASVPKLVGSWLFCVRRVCSTVGFAAGGRNSSISEMGVSQDFSLRRFKNSHGVLKYSPYSLWNAR